MTLARFAALAPLAAVLASAFGVPGLAGTWSGHAVHDGDSTVFALLLDPAPEGRTRIRATVPAIGLDSVTFGAVRADVRGDSVLLGPFQFVRGADGALRGSVPAGLLPVYDVPLTLRKVAAPPVVTLATFAAPSPPPAWTFRGAAPFWAGATLADGLVYAGDDAGVLHALDARTGAERWTYRAGGAIRSRAHVAGGALYLSADDGVVRRLDPRTGALAWQARVESTVVRHPFEDPRTKWDRFGAEPVLASGTLYVGTQEGRLVALDPATGKLRWEAKTGGAILAAPTVTDGRAYFGSFDGKVYAVDAGSGAPVWTFDTRMPVVSTPAVADGRVIVGSRSYDLFALDAKTGAPAWKRYLWFSWFESSPVVVDGLAIVGSSDASVVQAYRVDDGRVAWRTDVRGWAWADPTIAGDRVCIGTVGSATTEGRQLGAAFVLDRRDGRVVARRPALPRESGPFGFAGSPAAGGGFAYFPGLDSTVVALPLDSR